MTETKFEVLGQKRRMITKVVAGGAIIAAVLTGCTDREAEARRAREEAEAKARAEAAKKEMEAVPKVFQTPDYFKKNEPKKADPETAPKTDAR